MAKQKDGHRYGQWLERGEENNTVMEIGEIKKTVLESNEMKSTIMVTRIVRTAQVKQTASTFAKGKTPQKRKKKN